MRNLHHLLLSLMGFLLLNVSVIYAQDAVLSGTVTDSKGEAIPFCTVSTNVNNKFLGTQTDFDGNYALSVPAGTFEVTISFVGYKTSKQTVTTYSGQTASLNVQLSAETQMLETAVVTGGKHTQMLGEQTVSLAVIKPQLVENINSVSIDKAIEKVPGVDVIDGQANIRGGSGYSYGAGSRVLLLMDDLPIMNGDAGYPDWDFLPVENLDQVEIIKGASSALYGSSALNGIINMRTAYPKSQPETKFSFFSTIYQNPQNNTVIKYDTLTNQPIDTTKKAWWGNAFIFETGTSFGYKKKYDNFDLVTGGYLFAGDSWRKGNYNRRGRVNINTRYRVKGAPGLSVGLNLNTQLQTSGSFLIWNNLNNAGNVSVPDAIDEGAYQLWDATPPINNHSFAISVDPFAEYFNSGNGTRHKLLGRYYRNDNQNDTKQGTASDLMYGEYQFQKDWTSAHLVLTTGVVGTYVISNAELYEGDTKNSTNMAGYLQIDKKFWNKLNLSFGSRYEYNKIEGVGEAKPVFRLGANYQAAEYTYVRASWGQGYRFPTIAEKFVRTDLGQVSNIAGIPFGINVGIYPNSNLKSETGWSAELGLKQGFKIGDDWKGFFDLSGFVNDYNDMMEFTFGVDSTLKALLNLLPDIKNDLFPRGNFDAAPTYIPVTPGQFSAGFQSINIGDTRILGGEISLAGQGKLFGSPTNIMLGYTHINPTFKNFENDSVQQALTSSEKNVLKYRFRNTLKGDIETNPGRFSIGLTIQYYSFMDAIDQAFVALLPGIEEWRKVHNGGDLILDFRVGFKVSETSSISFLVKNITNHEYALRPALMDAPRNFTLRYAYLFKGKEKNSK